MIFNIFLFLVAIVSALSGFFMIFSVKPANKISKSAQHFVDGQRNTSYFDGSE
jgi:hypothetical protein